MKTTNDEPMGSTLPPATLRPELTERFLSAMQEASEEQEAEGLERRLRRLSPAPVGSGFQHACLESMQGVSAQHSYRGYGRALSRWGAAAALFVLCATGGVFMVNGSASATVPSGLACRSVVESHTGEAVQWQEGMRALRSCEVLYEDSFILEGEEESTIMVRVPVRAQVVIEDEVI